MARNVFRLTPRATQALRAVERSLRERLDKNWEGEDQTHKPEFVINACDIRFAKMNGKTIAKFERMQVMYTMPDDVEDFLDDQDFQCYVHMHEHRASNGFTYYTVEKVDLWEESDCANCFGTGKCLEQMPDGNWVNAECEYCGGSGESHTHHHCYTCNDTGLVEKADLNNATGYSGEYEACPDCAGH
jgi:hypothetical protein